MDQPVTLSGHRKVEQIAEHLRQQIIGGIYRPGGRLPTRDELTEHFGVSKVTVQKALERLSMDGFVVARGRNGTFVAENSPHLTRYMLLLPKSPESTAGNHFWRSLEWEAAALAGTAQIDLCHGFESWTGLNLYQELLDDILHNRLAGLIFASPPFMIEGSPLLTEPGIPRTGVMSKPQYGVPAVTMDDDAFMTRTLDYLASRGCRRPAMICGPRRTPDYLTRYLGELSARGMTPCPHFVQAVITEAPWWAGCLVRLLLDRPPGDRPDALIVGDDNLVEESTRALAELGYGDPELLPVVAACNFPWPTWSYRPVKRIGFDIHACLQACIRNIDLQRQGLMPPMRTVLPAVTEDEIPACNTPRRHADAPPTFEAVYPHP